MLDGHHVIRRLAHCGVAYLDLKTSPGEQSEKAGEGPRRATKRGSRGGSTLPMKTIDVRGGRSASSTTALATHACARISSVLKLRTKPMRPVAQKVQAMRQPTCEEMQSVVCARAFFARFPSVDGNGGMSTDSTSLPSARRRSSLRVASRATTVWESVTSSASGCSSSASLRWLSSLIRCRAACSRCAASSAHCCTGSNPRRRSRHTWRAPSSPPIRAAHCSDGSESSDGTAGNFAMGIMLVLISAAQSTSIHRAADRGDVGPYSVIHKNTVGLRNNT